MADDLVAVPAPVLAAGDVEPEVLAVGGFEDELVEVGVVLQKVEPAAGNGHVGMRPVVRPIGVGGSGEVDVGSLSQGVLGGIGTSHPEVELRATVARADDKGPLTHLGGSAGIDEGAQGLEHLGAEVAQVGDDVGMGRIVEVEGVVDAQPGGSGTSFELRERKVR